MGTGLVEPLRYPLKLLSMGVWLAYIMVVGVVLGGLLCCVVLCCAVLGLC